MSEILEINEQIIAKASLQARQQAQSMLSSLENILNTTSDNMLKMVVDYTGIQLFTIEQLEKFSPNFSFISYGDCLQRNCLVLEDELGNKLFIHDNPFDQQVYTWASYLINGYFELGFTHPIELKALLSRYETHQHVLPQLIGLEQQQSQNLNTEEISLTSIANDSSQIVRLVNSTLYDAQKSGASDIHFENTLTGLVIKYRIDGVLSTARHLSDLLLTEQVISRIKIMAELDIGEKRIPQDGRFSVNISAREIDFRVSIMPGLFGEDAVLRILDKQSITTDLSQLNLDILGVDASTKLQIRQLATQPYGMLLVTGPTGSGKTTTLYATLSEINFGNDKIITIEDPVEYQLSGVLQIPVNEKKGLTFARGLRSILRHDPDRILVGEIRDKETAEIAVQAALTGHLVYTTVHANNVFDVLSRFHHMGMDSYSFVTALNGVVAQRLVRLICTHCIEQDHPDQELLAQSGLAGKDLSAWTFKHGRGCIQCRGTGYKGRRALAEVLMLDDQMRELILNQTPVSQLKEKAREKGMRFMREQALSAVKDGKTTLEEINRVTFVE